LLTHPRVVPKLYEFIPSDEYKIRYIIISKNVGNQTVDGTH